MQVPLMRVAHLDGFAAPELSAVTLNHMDSMSVSVPTSRGEREVAVGVVLVRRLAPEGNGDKRPRSRYCSKYGFTAYYYHASLYTSAQLVQCIILLLV